MNWNGQPPSGYQQPQGFGPPQQPGYGTPSQGYVPATQQGFGPPQPQQNAFQPAQPISTVQAVRGISSAAVSLRYPEPPPDGRFKLQVIHGRSVPGEYGLAIFFECGICESPTHPNLVGTICTVKINGFGKPDRQQSAVRDVKSLLVALPAAPDLNEGSQLSDEQWAQLIDAAAPQASTGRQSSVIGRQFWSQTSEWSRRNPDGSYQKNNRGKDLKKLIHRFEKAA